MMPLDMRKCFIAKILNHLISNQELIWLITSNCAYYSKEQNFLRIEDGPELQDGDQLKILDILANKPGDEETFIGLLSDDSDDSNNSDLIDDLLERKWRAVKSIKDDEIAFTYESGTKRQRTETLAP